MFEQRQQVKAINFGCLMNQKMNRQDFVISVMDLKKLGKYPRMK